MPARAQSPRESAHAVGKSAGTVSPADPTVAPDWNRTIGALGGATFFHTSNWANVLSQTYGFTPAYLWHINDAGERSVMPAMETSQWLFGRRGVSLPFTDESPALLADAAAIRPLVDATLRQGASRAWTSWEFHGDRRSLGIEDAPASLSYFGHALALKGSSEELFAKIDGTARTAIRKAINLGVSVEFSNELADLRVFYDQLCRTRRKHGLPPQPFRFFTSIHRHALSAGHGTVAIARRGGIPVASAIFFHFGASAIYKFAASDPLARESQANHLVLWRAIERYAKDGFHRLDFGRTSRNNDGLRRFKLAWRPTEYDLDYTRYDFRREGFVAGGNERTTGWHTRVFRLLPPFVSRLIGAIAYKHMA